MRPFSPTVSSSQSNDSSSTLVFISLKNTNKDQCSAPLEVKKLRFEKKTILGVCSNQKLVCTYTHSLSLINPLLTMTCVSPVPTEL